MKKITITIFIFIFFNFNAHSQITLVPATPEITIDVPFGLAYNLGNYTGYSLMATFYDDDNNIIKTYTQIPRDGNYKISCSDNFIKPTSNIHVKIVGYVSDMCPNLEGNGYEECNYRNVNISAVFPVKYTNKTPNTTNLSQVQSIICSANFPTQVQFKTTDNYFYYHWYKNGVFLQRTQTNISPFISVTSQDMIGLIGENNCADKTSLYQKKVIAVDNATLVVAPVNLNSCFGKTFIINSSATNFSNIEWFTDSSLTTSIPNTWITGANGTQIIIPCDFTGNKTFYARAVNTEGCNSTTKSVELTANTVPIINTITNENITVCKKDNISFSAIGTSVKLFKWYKDIGKTTEITSSLSGVNNQNIVYDLSNLSAGPNKIYVQAISLEGCLSDIKPISFNVSDNSNTISTISQTTYCLGNTVNIQLNSASTTFQWFEDQAMNIPVNSSFLNSNGSVLSYLTSTVGSKTYWYRSLNSDNCPSNLYSIIVVVKQKPSNLIVTNQNAQVCKGQNIVFEVGANSALSYAFYSNNLGSIPITNNVNDNTYTVNTTTMSPGNYSFWVKAISTGGCETALTQVNYSVLDLPTNLSVIGNKAIYCSGDQIDITPIATNATSYIWSYNSAFNNLVEASKLVNGKLKYIPTTNESTIYWVKGVGVNGCETTPISVTINVSQRPIDVGITNNNTSICFGQTISFAAYATYEDSFKFYSNASGTNQIASPQAQNNIVTFNSTNYTVGTNIFYFKAINNNGCESNLQTVTFTVLAQPSSFNTTGITNYCNGDFVNIVPSALNTNSYIWSSNSNFDASSILTSQYVQNGILHYQANTTGTFTYYVKAKNNNGCESNPLTVVISIKDRPKDYSITNNNSTVCKGQNIQFVAGANGSNIQYKFWQNDIGTIPITMGVNGNVYTINTTNSDPGTYTFWANSTINTCDTDLVKVTYDVLAQPTNLLITGTTNYCTNDTVLITPSATNATSYIWAYDANFNNLVEASKIDSKGNLNYIATTSIANQTYYVKAINANGCQTSPVNVSITIKQGVTNLSITNNKAIVCLNNPITFTAGATNATSYLFYQNEELTIPLTTGVNSNVYAPSTATKGLYSFWVVGSNSNGCQSQSLKVDYEIIDSPTNFSYFGNTAYCRGQQIIITPSANNATKYLWAYDANFNNQVEAANIDAQYRLNFTSSIIGKTTYYVKAVNSNGCSSEAKTIDVEIKIEPTGLILTDLNTINTYCQGNIYTYTASAVNASNYQWSKDIGFTDLVPATMIGGTNSNTLNINTSLLNIGQHTWYVRALNVSGCTTQEIKFAFNVVENTGTTTASIADNTVCSGELLNISLSNNSTKTKFKWYLDQNGTPINPIYISSTSSQLTIPANLFNNGQNVIYYKAYNQNCEGGLIALNFTVLTSPTNLDVTNNGASVCKGKNIIFEASAINANAFEFYKDAALLLPLDNSFINGAKGFRLTLPTSDYTVGTHTLYLVAISTQSCKTTPLAFTFTVNDIPGPTSITGSTTYCLNENIKFSLINSNTTKFTWFSDSNGLNPMNSQYLSNDGATFVMPATSTELKKLYYRAINSSGCMGAIQEVAYTVLPAPSNITITNNSVSYCSNETIDIIAGANNATEFEWFLDSKATTLVDKAFLYGNLSERYRPVNLVPGDYSVWVRGKNIQGCYTQLVQVDFVVRIKPIIKDLNTLSNISIFKIGDEIIFNIEGLNYDRYKILKNNTNFIPNNNTYVNGNITQFILTKNATLADEGVYKLILSNGTCQEEKDLPIIIIPQDVILTHDKSSSIANDNGTSKIILKNHESIQFTSTISYLKNYTFEWDFGDGFSNTLGKHFYNNTGDYSVSVKITNTVIKQSFIMKYALPVKIILDKETVDFNPFNPIKDAKSILYPNPVIDNINIKINNTGTAYKGICRIYSYDGITLFIEEVLVQPGTNTFTFNNPLINQPTGAYILKFYKGENDSDQFKVLKQ